MNGLISLIAQYAILISAGVALAVWIRLRRSRKWEFGFTAAIGGLIAFGLLKIGSAVYYDPRPFVTGHIAPLFPHPADNGFPSDHTLLAMVLAMCVLSYSRKWGVALVALAVAIGAARVAAHVHHWADIFGAMAFAVIAVFISRRATLRLTRG
jgi:undecaprenyl-diphosphatase